MATEPKEASASVPEDAQDELYVVYWCEENGYSGSCDFVHAGSTAEARERSTFASGGVAHQRLIFEGTYDEFAEYVEENLGDSARNPPRFSINWE